MNFPVLLNGSGILARACYVSTTVVNELSNQFSTNFETLDDLLGAIPTHKTCL